MGTTAQKLLRVAMSKADIGSAIVDKGRGIVPPYDAEIEYLETTETGTFCIRTGVMMTRYREFDATFSHIRRVSGQSGWKALIGTRYNTTRAMFYISPNATLASVSINFDYGSSTQGAVVSGISTTNPLHIGIRRTGSYATGYVGNKIKNTTAIDFSETTDDLISLLPHYDKIMFRCYGFYILDFDGTLLFDGIPVRVGQTGYLYDRANPYGGPNGNGLYGNLGTGSFVLGPDVGIPSKRVMPKKFSQWGDEIRKIKPADLSDYDSTFLVFYDLDGNSLYYCSKQQVQSWVDESNMPPVPPSPNPNIYSDGRWNWTYDDTRTALTNNTPGFVAPQYTRSDNATMVKVEFDENTEIQLYETDGDVNVDWGDGSNVDTVSDGVPFPHSFLAGKYWIKITISSGKHISLGGNTVPMILPKDATTTSGNRFDAMKCVKELYIGRNFQTVSNTVVGAKNIERIHYDSYWTVENNISSTPYRGTGQGYTNSFIANKYIPYRSMIIPRGYGDLSRNGDAMVGVNIKLIAWHPRARFYGNGGWNFCGFGNQVEHIRIPYIGTVTDSTSALFRYSLRALDIFFGLDILSGVNGNYTFGDCQACRKIVFHNGFSSTRTVSNMFLNCRSLQELVGFNMRNIAIFNTASFQNCYSMKWGDLYLPNVTTFGTSSFSGNVLMFSLKAGTKGTDLVISNNSFTSCVNLLSAEFDGNVTSVGSAAFQGNAKMVVVRFDGNTQVPTLANVNAFANTSALAEIVVPDNLYDDWKAATNWSSTTNGIVNKITKASVYGGYTSRVEYIESTGTQYIDTGVMGDHLTGFEINCTPFAAANQRMGAMGGSPDYLRCYVIQNVGQFTIALNANNDAIHNTNILPEGTTAFKVSYDAELTRGKIDDVDVVLDESYAEEWTTGNTFYLFAQNQGGANMFCQTKLYGAKIFYNDKLIHDYIPVRVDSTGCLYDRMTDDLIYNQGTGDFIVGPDV